jgi:phage-related protein
LPVIGKACHELRIIDRDKTWRIVYSIEVDAVVILEIFAKKTNKTPKRVIEVSQHRLNLYHEIIG